MLDWIPTLPAFGEWDGRGGWGAQDSERPPLWHYVVVALFGLSALVLLYVVIMVLAVL